MSTSSALPMMASLDATTSTRKLPEADTAFINNAQVEGYVLSPNPGFIESVDGRLKIGRCNDREGSRSQVEYAPKLSKQRTRKV